MTSCDTCYESAPVCMNNTPGGTTCSAFLHWTGAYRGSNGVYGAELRSALPGEFGSVDDGHIDTLTGYTAPTSAVAVLSTGDAAMRAKLVADSLLRTELGEVANYLSAHPEDREMIRRNVNRILNDYPGDYRNLARPYRQDPRPGAS